MAWKKSLLQPERSKAIHRNNWKKSLPFVNQPKEVRKSSKARSSLKAILNKPADLFHLQNERKRLRLASKASSTWGQYGPAFKRFANWCIKEDQDFLPASSETVELFIIQLADWFKSPHSASMAFAAISAQHKLEGLPSPCSAQSTKDVLEGIRREYGAPAKQREGLSCKELKTFINFCIGHKSNRSGSILQWRTAWTEFFLFRAQARWGDVIRMKIGQFSF